MRKEMIIHRASLVVTAAVLSMAIMPTIALASGEVLDIPGGGLTAVFLNLVAWLLQIGLAAAAMSLLVSAGQHFQPETDGNNLLAIRHNITFSLLVAIADLAGLEVTHAISRVLLH